MARTATIEPELLAGRYEFHLVPNEHGGYWVRVPAFPSLFTGGPTAAAAAVNAVEAIGLALEWYAERGLEPPAPTLVATEPV